jgi:predicted HNH restriction endonuclease
VGCASQFSEVYGEGAREFIEIYVMGSIDALDYPVFGWLRLY